ncbi:MAG TPA: DUF47 family protein [Bryobacteraceae bacterium]|nr:DUF47 family protein [Bryobacteraceae bacterium]
MRFSLIPREESFFDLFEKSAQILNQAAQLLVETLNDYGKVHENALRMERLEHDGDQIVHEISARLNSTFITPLDREDIHTLASHLDDVLDLIEQATERFVLFKVKEPTQPAIDLANVIAKQVEQIDKLMPRLRDPKHDDIMPVLVEINRLENTGDKILRDALAQLFEDGSDPMFVIRWSHLYEVLEDATDHCEDVAMVVENILVKNG